jgi:hypothetical protein
MEGAQKPGDFPNDESAVKLIYLACDLMPPTPRPIVAAFNRSLCQELLTDPNGIKIRPFLYEPEHG